MSASPIFTQNIPNLPTLPEVPSNGRGHLVADVTFDVPDTQDVLLGSIPREGWDLGLALNQRVPNEGEKCNVFGGSPVRVQEPVLDAGGTVRMQSRTFHFDVEPEKSSGRAERYMSEGFRFGGGWDSLWGLWGYCPV